MTGFVISAGHDATGSAIAAWPPRLASGAVLENDARPRDVRALQAAGRPQVAGTGDPDQAGRAELSGVTGLARRGLRRPGSVAVVDQVGLGLVRACADHPQAALTVGGQTRGPVGRVLAD